MAEEPIPGADAADEFCELCQHAYHGPEACEEQGCECRGAATGEEPGQDAE